MTTIATPLPGPTEATPIEGSVPGSERIRDPAVRAEYERTYRRQKAWAEQQKEMCEDKMERAVSNPPASLRWLDHLRLD